MRREILIEALTSTESSVSVEVAGLVEIRSWLDADRVRHFKVFAESVYPRGTEQEQDRAVDLFLRLCSLDSSRAVECLPSQRMSEPP